MQYIECKCLFMCYYCTWKVQFLGSYMYVEEIVKLQEKYLLERLGLVFS